MYSRVAIGFISTLAIRTKGVTNWANNKLDQWERQREREREHLRGAMATQSILLALNFPHVHTAKPGRTEGLTMMIRGRAYMLCYYPVSLLLQRERFRNVYNIVYQI